MREKTVVKILFLLTIAALSICFASCTPAQVSKPGFSETGIATWKNVGSAEKYEAQLYRNNEVCGTPQSAIDGQTGCNFLSLMKSTGEGNYTVRVTAIGKSEKETGKQSEDSNPQTVSKVGGVTTLSLSENGEAVWTVTNTAKYDIKLYKDSTLISTKTDAVSGCNFLDMMRENGPGNYSITVIAKADTDLLLNADESEPSAAVTVAYLDTPQPVWSAATLKWDPEPNATGYQVVLYKDGNVTATKDFDPNTTSFDFQTMMEQYPAGTFDATIQANGTGLYLSSPVSDHSLTVVDPPGLAQIGKPSLSSSGTANWTNVANADQYAIQLYSNGLPFGESIIAVDGKTGCDLLSVMRNAGPGNYSVKVTAKGGEGFNDSLPSEVSEEQAIVKADKVTGVALSSNGLVTWNETNGKSYELKIYKNESVVDTVEAAAQGFSCYEAIKKYGAGKYSVTITAKSDTGLLIDSDMSAPSNILAAGPVSIMSGTVENTFQAAKSVDKNSDSIVVTNVEPKSGIKDGVATKFVIDVEYNLMSLDECMVMICSNFDISTNNSSRGYIEVTRYKIAKGSGSLRFVVEIEPKRWSDGTPFFITAGLVEIGSSGLVFSLEYNLSF